MKKVELLSPAGNMEALLQAIHAGADAVYLGGKKFGARAYASNFDNEEMTKAIKLCHLYGVKIYVTINTIIYEKEIEESLNYIKFLHENGVDALIMQDLGLISIVRQKYPNLEIHASTQAHNHNDEGLKAMRDIGITRVVLAREMSLSEINELSTNIEKEVFIHGALCISYSGCCLFSSLNGGRSGNRGECVGSCRLPYELYSNDKLINVKGEYLLSTKELCTIEHLKELLDSNITSFKIEGRMKSPEYVGYITRLYRTLIDKYYSNEEMIVSEEDLLNIKKLYNRELTKGFLFNSTNKELMNIKTPNHIGIPVGEVVSYDKDKIRIKLSYDLNQEDGIRLPNNEGMIVNMLYNEKGLLVNKIFENNIAIIDNKINLSIKGIVSKTVDSLLMKDLKNYEEKKINITIKCNLTVGKEIELILDDNEFEVIVKGQMIEKAINAPVSAERIKEQLLKLGNTPFKCFNIEINLSEEVFISIKELNELRRLATEKLIFKRENRKKEVLINDIEQLPLNNNSNDKLSINILVRDEDQLVEAINNNVDNIYITDYKLYNKYKSNKTIYYRTKRVNNVNKDFNNLNILATELGSVYKYSKNNSVVSDYYLNVVNSNTIRYFDILGVKRVTLSPELNYDSIKELMNDKYNVELVIYGKVELMVMKYCPLNLLINNDNDNCMVCRADNHYYLKDRIGNKYEVLGEDGITHIMHYKNIDMSGDLDKYKKLGIKNYRIELLSESKEEVAILINKIRRLL